MADAAGILIVGDVIDGQLGSTSKELLAAGRQIANNLNESVSIALLGSSTETAGTQAIESGTDIVYLVNNPALESYHIDFHLAALKSLVDEISPRIILMGRTAEGRELAPRLAFRLGVGLAQDCLEVSIDTSNQTLLANRPVYGGSAVAVVSCEQTPQIAAIRPKAYEPLETDSNRSGETVSLSLIHI